MEAGEYFRTVIKSYTILDLSCTFTMDAMKPETPESLRLFATQIVERHRVAHGSTTSLLLGDMMGHPRFAVGVSPERAQKFANFPTIEDIENFIVANRDLLGESEMAVGTWFWKELGVHVVEPVRCVQDLQIALQMALANSQVSIFDLLTNKEIPVAGNVGQKRPPEILTTFDSKPCGFPATA